MGTASWALLREIVAEREFTKFIGLEEGLYFEAKNTSAYDLTRAEGRYELAKDATALANSEGGWLVLGLSTAQLVAAATDEVVGLDLLPAGSFVASQIKGILREYVHPSMVGLTVEWSEDKSAVGLGLGIIHVPVQASERKPFLIAKVVEDAAHLKQVIFGYARRVGSDSLPHTVDQLHRAMKVGMHPTSQRLTSLEEKVNLLLEAEFHPAIRAPEVSDTEQKAKLEARLSAILEVQE